MQPLVARTVQAALSLSCVLLAGCGGGVSAEGEADAGRLTVTGSSTCAPLVAEMARRFEAAHAGVRVDVQTGGSSKGISDAMRGLADIGMASRDLKGDELDGAEAHTLALDGVGLLVHASNPVGDLDRDAVRAIYRGEIDDWSEVGGPDGEITVVNKAAGRATLEVFLAHFDLEEGEIDADVVIGDNQQGIKTVAGNPLAIGYVSIGAGEGEIAAGSPIRFLGTGGVAATSANLAAGSFPISRRLNLVTKGAPEGLALEFVEFCRSEANHDLVRELGFVPFEARR